MTKENLAWLLPVVLAVAALIGFLIRVLVKSFTKSLDRRLTQIDGGQDPAKGSLGALKKDVGDLNTTIQQWGTQVQQVNQISSVLSEMKTTLKDTGKKLTDVCTSLPKDYVLKTDCLSARVSIEHHLTNLVNKIDRVLETLHKTRR